MTDNFDNNKKFTPYKEIVKKRVLDYYYMNKEVISQKRKEKYKEMPLEDKKKLVEYDKCLKDNEKWSKKLICIIKIDIIWWWG